MSFFLRGISAQLGMLCTRFTVLFLLLASSAYSQITYVSADNKKTDWDTNSTWTRLPASETWAPASPGNPTNSNTNAINVYGYLRAENGLTINNANPVVTVYDTLFIVGNVYLGSGASLNVTANGILIITGNLTLDGSFNLANGGNIVVKGNLNVPNGSVQNSSHFYTFGSTSASGGGKVNGCDGYGNPSGCNPATAGNIGNSSALQSQNLPLYNFVNNGGVLPVQLLYFRAVHDGSVNKLSWATASELNFDYFNLQRSSDGRKFETIAAVKGNGTTKEQHNYSFSDTYLLNGTSYYRLQSVDFDGYTETFSVVSLSYEAARNAFLYPIPVVNSNLNIRLNFEPKNEIKVSVFSISGIERIKGIIKANEIDAYIDLSLEPGVYIVKMSSIDFNKVSRIVVK